MWLVLSLVLCGVCAVLLMATGPRWFWALTKKHQRFMTAETEQFFIARFVFIQSRAVVGMVWVVLLCLATVLVIIGVPVGLVVVLKLVVLLAWPFFLRYLHKKRIERFEKQFPDFMLALASALRAGSSLRIGLQRLVPHSQEPIRQELELCLKELRMGLSLSQALNHLHQRTKCESTALFKSALVVAGQSGGGLAELLENMAQTISTRTYIEGRINALTAQGRLQAWIMVLLPVIVGVALYAIDANLVAPLWQERVGQILLTVMVVLELIGLWWIQRLVTVPL